MTGPPPDPEILRRAAAGDRSAWEALLKHLHQPLMSFVGSLIPNDLKSRVEPQDILNDTYFEAYRRIGEFTAIDDQSVFRWLATIARHQLINTVKAQRCQKRGGRSRQIDTAAVGEDGQLIELLHDLAIYERTPSRSAMRHELRIALETSISRLEAPLRQALRLRHLSGLPFKDVAVQMSRTERAVQQLCTRAMRQLRHDLESASYFV